MLKRAHDVAQWIFNYLLENAPASRYEVAKKSPYPTSTVYYHIDKMRERGLIYIIGGEIHPTLSFYIEYFKTHGCSEKLAKSLAKLLYPYAEGVSLGEICEGLETLSNGLSTEILTKIVQSSSKFFAALFAKFGNTLDELHRGHFINGVFIGHCKVCGTVVKKCEFLRLT